MKLQRLSNDAATFPTDPVKGGQDATSKATTHHDRATGNWVQRLVTRAIKHLAPQPARAHGAHRSALKAAHKELSHAIQAVASGKLEKGQKASAKVAEALRPLTAREPDDSDLLERLCGACLSGELPLRDKHTLKDLEDLERGLATLAKNAPNRVLEQIDLSVKAEILQRRLAALDGQDALLGNDRPRAAELRAIEALASALIAKASRRTPTNDTIPGTRYTLKELVDFQKNAINALALSAEAEEVEKKKSAKPAPIAQVPTAKGPVAKGPVAEGDDVITARLIGPKDEFNPKKLTAIELFSTWKAISVQSRSYLPDDLANAAKAIQAEVELRKGTIQSAFQAALRATLRNTDAALSADLLLSSFAQLREATTLYSAIGQRLRNDDIALWMGEVFDEELARGEAGLACLRSLQASLVSGEGKVIRDVLSRSGTQRIFVVDVAAGYLHRLTEALDEMLPIEPSPTPQNAKGVKHLSTAATNALRRYLHVDPQPSGNTPFIDLEPEIQTAKEDLARLRPEHIVNAHLRRLQALAYQVSLLAIVSDNTQHSAHLKDLTAQLLLAPNLDQATAEILQEMSDGFDAL